jgi:hypothetical protein
LRGFTLRSTSLEPTVLIERRGLAVNKQVKLGMCRKSLKPTEARLNTNHRAYDIEGGNVVTPNADSNGHHQ